MFVRPGDQRLHSQGKRYPKLGDRVVDARRDGRIRLTVYQAIEFKATESLREDPRRDIADSVPEFSETIRTRFENRDRQKAPLIADAVQHLTEWTVCRKRSAKLGIRSDDNGNYFSLLRGSSSRFPS